MTLTKQDHPLSESRRSPASRTAPKHLLIVVDDSEASIHAVHYVGTLLREIREVSVTLFHVLNPMPRELMEHGGSEDPEIEDHLGEQLRKEQEAWLRTEGAIEYPILVKALEHLGQTGFPIDHVTLKFGYERDIADTILDEARAGEYGTIVVPRGGPSGAKRLFGGSVTDRLMRELPGVALWVLE